MPVEPRTMASVMQALREQSPALDQAIEAAAPRRELALALTGLRKDAGLTWAQLAAALGCDPAHISRIESPAGPWPARERIEFYAHACGARAGYVFATGSGADARVVTALLRRIDY